MTRQEYAKNLRNWRIKKVAMYLIGAVLLVLGLIVFIQSFLIGDLMQDTWKFVVGFAIFALGLLIFADAWNESFKDYKNKKKIR